jgi:hypothetical protein
LIRHCSVIDQFIPHIRNFGKTSFTTAGRGWRPRCTEIRDGGIRQTQLARAASADYLDSKRRTHFDQEPDMNTERIPTRCLGRYELWFPSLFDEGRGFSFPCDAAGRVDLDTLGERARNNYLYARAVVGRDYASPAVRVLQ